MLLLFILDSIVIYQTVVSILDSSINASAITLSGSSLSIQLSDGQLNKLYGSGSLQVSIINYENLTGTFNNITLLNNQNSCPSINITKSDYTSTSLVVTFSITNKCDQQHWIPIVAGIIPILGVAAFLFSVYFLLAKRNSLAHKMEMYKRKISSTSSVQTLNTLTLSEK